MQTWPAGTDRVTTAAYAVVRSDPPEVFLAEDGDTLDRVLATRLVAATDPAGLEPVVADGLRQALLEERWADALVEWMAITETAVDVYPPVEIHSADSAPADLVGARLQFTKLFETEHDAGVEPDLAQSKSGSVSS